MEAILSALIYVILGALALVLAFILIRLAVRFIPHFIVVVTEYVWHNLLVLLVAAAIIGAFVAMFLLL